MFGLTKFLRFFVVFSSLFLSVSSSLVTPSTSPGISSPPSVSPESSAPTSSSSPPSSSAAPSVSFPPTPPPSSADAPSLVPTPLPSPPSLAPSPGPPDPTIFVTFHGGDAKKDVNNIYRYSLNGQFMGQALDSSTDTHLHGLRGLLYVEAIQHILVANAYIEESKILKLSVEPNSSFTCSGSGPAKDFITSSSLQHPYSIQLNPHDQSLTVANQGVGLNNSSPELTQYSLEGKSLGVLADVGDPRGLTWLMINGSSYLFACDKSVDRVLKLDHKGKPVSKWSAKVRNPIAVTTCNPPSGQGTPWLLVSSNDASDPAVFALDSLKGGDTTGSAVSYLMKYADPYLGHPCGLTTLGNTLYVLSQDTYALLTFDLSSGLRLKVLITDMPDVPEGLLIVSLPACSIPPTPKESLPPSSEAASKVTPADKIPQWFLYAGGGLLVVVTIAFGVAYWWKKRVRVDPASEPAKELSYTPPLVQGSVQVNA